MNEKIISNWGHRWLINKTILLKLTQIWDKVIKHNRDYGNIRKYKFNIFKWIGICENKLNEGMNKQINDNDYE